MKYIAEHEMDFRPSCREEVSTPSTQRNLPGMVVTAHNKSEWSRMAKDAYSRDFLDYGHRFSAAAAMREGSRITCEAYDALQTQYREWLNNGWKNVTHTSGRGKVDYFAPCDFAGCSMCLNHPGAHSNI